MNKILNILKTIGIIILVISLITYLITFTIFLWQAMGSKPDTIVIQLFAISIPIGLLGLGLIHIKGTFYN